MLLFRVYGNEFPDQCAGPIVKGHVTADTGTGQMNLSAISKGSVNMVIAGDEGCIFPAFHAIQNLLGVLQVFQCGCGLGFPDDIRFRNTFLN